MADPRDITNTHTDALEALLIGAGYPLYVAEVTDPEDAIEYPYLCLYPGTGTKLRDSLAASFTHHGWTWQITAVGRDRTETAAALDRGRDALVGKRPVVAGCEYGVISEDVLDQPIRKDPAVRDPATRRPVFYGVAQFRVPSTAA